jgi:hypothetical protein
MERKVIIFIGLFFCLSNTWAQSSHLLLVSKGDGATTLGTDGKSVTLPRASFLPDKQNISVRPKSGIETMVAGGNFRFGHETNFMLENRKLTLNGGGMMIRSRKIDQPIIVQGPEVSLVISGAGTCLLEVETSGGFKIIGVLGRFRLQSESAETSAELMPGDLCFLMPGGRGFGKKVNVNLKKLISTSFLLSGFPNSQSFATALENIANQQGKSIGKSYNAQVGDSKKPDSFEIISTRKNESDLKEVDTIEDGNKSASYKIPPINPLEELLGRAPRRFGENAITPISKESSAKLGELVAPTETPAESEVLEDDDKAKPRPFPSRLLRKNKIEK